MQQITVRAVQLDGVDAEPFGAPGGGDKGVADALQAGVVERVRRAFALLVRQRRTAPPSASRLCPAAAICPPSHGRALERLAAGMGELHRDGGLRMLAYRGEDRLQRGLVGVAVETEATGRDAADRLDMGGLDAEHRSARQR